MSRLPSKRHDEAPQGRSQGRRSRPPYEAARREAEDLQGCRRLQSPRPLPCRLLGSPRERRAFRRSLSQTRSQQFRVAGVGSEDEDGPRGNIRHKGDFAAQCAYAYDKIKRALAANGSSLKDAVKMTVYVTDMRYRLDWAKCSGEAFAGATVPAQTLIGISQLAFPEMMLEIDVTAVAHE